ncbi:MAG: hypothetical protein E4G98_07255 [Promethearchaeota archaeon]|nr:MAG: hypothetical protein E4G98_07255 [Candidatus Lokiarchaeota archaeon]
MSEFSTFMKNFGKALLVYVLFNLVFVLLYPLLNGISYGYYITDWVFKDVTGLITALLIPGGGIQSGDVFSSVAFYLGDLINYWGVREYSILWDIVGLLWVILPGLITAILMGKKWWSERPTKAFWNAFFTIFILTILPLIFIFVIQINGIHLFTGDLIPDWLLTHDRLGNAINWVPSMYLNIILVGIMNGLFWGGIATVNSTDL